MSAAAGILTTVAAAGAAFIASSLLRKEPSPSKFAFKKLGNQLVAVPKRIAETFKGFYKPIKKNFGFGKNLDQEYVDRIRKWDAEIQPKSSSYGPESYTETTGIVLGSGPYYTPEKALERLERGLPLRKPIKITKSNYTSIEQVKGDNEWEKKQRTHQLDILAQNVKLPAFFGKVKNYLKNAQSAEEKSNQRLASHISHFTYAKSAGITHTLEETRNYLKNALSAEEKSNPVSSSNVSIMSTGITGLKLAGDAYLVAPSKIALEYLGTPLGKVPASEARFLNALSNGASNLGMPWESFKKSVNGYIRPMSNADGKLLYRTGLTNLGRRAIEFNPSADPKYLRYLDDFGTHELVHPLQYEQGLLKGADLSDELTYQLVENAADDITIEVKPAYNRLMKYRPPLASPSQYSKYIPKIPSAAKRLGTWALNEVNKNAGKIAFGIPVLANTCAGLTGEKEWDDATIDGITEGIASYAGYKTGLAVGGVCIAKTGGIGTLPCIGLGMATSTFVTDEVLKAERLMIDVIREDEEIIITKNT